MSTPTSLARFGLASAVAAGLAMAGAAGLATPTHADAVGCPTAYPVADLTTGQPVHGLTVTAGNDPQSGAFTGTVIGVLHNGIEPDVDMVLADLTSPQIDGPDGSGIWEGMSGSPVYAADDRLIGAVAYTLSWGATSVAGITPWEQSAFVAPSAMPTRVAIGERAARTIARATDVTRAQASQGLVELRTPWLVSGLGARALARATGRPYLESDVSAAGRAVNAPSAGTMAPGSNLVATESTGDIVSGALGTVTWVCGAQVVGFGHPMEFVGRASYGMAGADALLIQSDPLGSAFKVVNIGHGVGLINEDRMTGISGVLGAGPPQFPVVSDLTYTSGTVVKHRVGISHVQLPLGAAGTTYYESMANHQRVLDAFQGGSETQRWIVAGTNGGVPFTLTAGNRYTDSADVADAGAYDLPDLVWLLSQVDGVKFTRIKAVTAVTDTTAVHEVSGLQQRRAGRWQTVTGAQPAQLTAGATATFRLRYDNGDAGAAFSVPVPARAAGFSGRLYVDQSPGWWFEQENPGTFAGIQRLVRTMPRNDQAVYNLEAGGERGDVHVHGLTTSESEVITGSGSFRVVVR